MGCGKHSYLLDTQEVRGSSPLSPIEHDDAALIVHAQSSGQSIRKCDSSEIAGLGSRLVKPVALAFPSQALCIPPFITLIVNRLVRVDRLSSIKIQSMTAGR